MHCREQMFKWVYHDCPKKCISILEFTIYPTVRFCTTVKLCEAPVVPWAKELYRHQSLNVVFTGHFCLGCTRVVK